MGGAARCSHLAEDDQTWKKSSARSDTMIAQRIEWQSDAAPRFPQQSVASRESVRFWQPAPEFSCAYIDGGSAALHVHEEWQFAVSAEPCNITLGAFRRYTAHGNDVTVVAPYDVHTEGGLFGGPRGWLVLNVAPSTVHRVYSDNSAIVPRFDPVVRDAASAHRLATLLQWSLEGSIAASNFEALMLEWLRHLMSNNAVTAATPQPIGGARAPVERARAYLQAHPTEPLALSDLVDLAGVTASHLVRSFSRTVGLPPKSYHTQVRLARARRLLAEGRPATWVAYECGFADQSHLSRRFKEFYGLTPGAFQRYFQEGPVSADMTETSNAPAAVSINAA
jgi:AraC-like DNA-binding protein